MSDQAQAIDDPGISGDRFDLRGKLGAGGVGTVYRAWDRERGQEVALKILRTRDAAALYRFKKEFRALADVTHVHLATLYELFADDDRWYFTMELIEGTTFYDYVRPGAAEHQEAPTVQDGRDAPSNTAARPGEFDVDRLRRGLRDLAVAIRTLHAHGFLHRDLKPSNVLVTPEERVVILDFGLATELQPDRQTLDGVAGTIGFMPPEQTTGGAMTEAADWYAFGSMLFQALTAQLPFNGTVFQVILAKQQEDPPSPADLRDGLPADLTALCEKLLARDPAARPDGAAVLAALGAEDDPARLASRRQTLLIGRQQQLGELRDAYLRGRGGEPVAVYIHGPSGMGKTTLVEIFLDSLTQLDLGGGLGGEPVILRGRCYEREMVPYKALDGIVDSLSRVLASRDQDDVAAMLPEDIPALVRLFPVLARVLPRKRAKAADVEGTDLLTLRRQGFGALREILRRMAAEHPLVLYIDDLQWADADSIALLEDLLRPPEAPPLLLMASFRSEEIDRQPFLREILSQTGDAARRSIEIGMLEDPDARQLVSVLLADVPDMPPPVIESIVREGRGSPFLIEQLASFVRIKRERLTTGISLVEMLEERLRPLPEGARPLLLTMTVANRPLDIDIACEAAGVGGDLQRLVAALRAAHLVRSSGSAERLELYHDRIGEILSELVDAFERQSVHRRLASALEAHGAADPESLFAHYLGAGDRPAAARQAVLAARKAFTALAFDPAARFYRRALELEAAKDPLERRELQRGLADSLANAGRSSDAAELYLELADGEQQAALALRCRAAEQYLMGGHLRRGLTVAAQVLEAVDLKMPKGGRKRALISLLLNRVKIRLRGLKFEPRQAEQIPSSELVRIDTCWAIATGLSLADNIRGADFQTRHLLLALKAGEPYRISRALAMDAGFMVSTGGLDRAEVLLERAMALAKEVESPHAEGLVMMNRGLLDYFSGRSWSRAAASFDDAESTFRQRCRGVAWEVTMCRRFVLASLMYQGQLGELTRRVPIYLAEARERGDTHLANTVRTRINIVWLAADDPAEARRRVEESFTAGEQRGFSVDRYNALLAFLQADLYEGHPLTAWERFGEHREALAGSMLLRVQLVKVETAHIEARIALALASRGENVEANLALAAKLAAKIAAEKCPYGRPLADLLEAGICAARGDAAGARDKLQRGLAGCETTGTGLYAAAARRRLGVQAGGERGAKIVVTADAWMNRQRILNPAAMTAMLIPGFPETQGER